MRSWVAMMGLLTAGLAVLTGCKEDPACVAHVECSDGLRCIEGTCQMADPMPGEPEPTPPQPDMPEPDMPEPEPTPPEPDMLMDMTPPDGGPDMNMPDMGPGGPDRALFEQTINDILRGRCGGCHGPEANPGDGSFDLDSGMFDNNYEEVQEFINTMLPDQSDLLRYPTGVGHPMIWAVGDDDYNQVLNWIRTGR